jgi:putative DNA primase/helicase
MTINEVAQRFNATQSGDHFMARCPAHDDDKPSLNITLKGDKILVNCFAGCNKEAVLGAVGLTLKDLFPSNANQPAKSAIVATYLYRDLHSTVRYRKQRTADKRFYFARPDGDGGWITSNKQNRGKALMAGVERLPYRLNELVGYAAIFICEGEKDADRLWSLECPATTSDLGASKPNGPTRSHSISKAGVTSVVCLPDHDAPGYAHMTRSPPAAQRPGSSRGS